VKKTTLVVLLILSTFAWAKPIPNPADYTINVHVSKSYFGERGSQMVKAVIDGKKYELVARPDYPMLLALGDYKAKLVKDEHRGIRFSTRIRVVSRPKDKEVFGSRADGVKYLQRSSSW
jgi:O-acetylhomoserine/O-acetylserine sulfhydrylase-like pyridoxal-dependent enzyme